MATMNVSLPDQMKAWVEEQARGGRYGNASDYVRDLIRRDERRQRALAEMRAFVQEGIDSGLAEPFDMEEFLFRKRAARAAKRD